MLPDTFDVRKAAKLLNNDRFATAIANILLANEVTTFDEIDDHAMVVDEIRVKLFGQSYSDDVRDELNDQIGELTRPSADVYYALGNGHSLCTARLRVKVTSATGTEMVVIKNARFVSEDPDIVAKYRLQPQFERLDRTMERLSATIAEDTARIPALAQRTPGMIRHSHGVLTRELPAPSNGGTGS